MFHSIQINTEEAENSKPATSLKVYQTNQKSKFFQ